MLGPEIRPQHLEEQELRIGRLPQQEVGQPLLAGGTDDKVRIGHAGGGQMCCQQRLVHLFGLEDAGRHLGRHGTGGGGDLGPRAVGNGKIQIEPRAAGGGSPRPRRWPLPSRRQSGPSRRSRAAARPFLTRFGTSVRRYRRISAVQVPHLFRRTGPVLGGKGEQRQPGDARLRHRLHRAAGSLRPALWPRLQGRPRRSAQRRLPSMMMPRCTGSRPLPGVARAATGTASAWPIPLPSPRRLTRRGYPSPSRPAANRPA